MTARLRDNPDDLGALVTQTARTLGIASAYVEKDFWVDPTTIITDKLDRRDLTDKLDDRVFPAQRWGSSYGWLRQ